MKKLIQLTLLALALAAAPVGWAFTYQDEDLLLVFRKDQYNDVVFNLGPVGQVLNKTNGQQVVLTNWDPSLVQSNYDFGDSVSVILLATTSSTAANRRVWLTSTELTGSPLDRTPSQWQSVWSKITAVGTKPQDYSQTNPNPAFVSAPTLPASYTYVASNAGSAPALIPKLGGTSTFVIEGLVPAELKFYEIKPSSAATKPPSTLVGTFTFGLTGALTFTAGIVPPPAIASTSRSADVATVTFPTLQGWNYRLRYNDDLVVPVSSWTFLDTAVAGTGGPQSLSDTNSGPVRFYSLERNP